MSRFLGIGNGKDGIIALGSYTQLKYSCSGTAGSRTLTATGSFSAGQRLFIHQTRGSSGGKYEDNRVASYSTGTVTLVHPLENTYTNSGNNQPQVLIVKEASKVTGSYSISAWDGDTGGLFVMACSGLFSGTVNGNAKGYRGGRGGYLDPGSEPHSGATGESYYQASVAGGQNAGDTDSISPTNNGSYGAGGGGRGARADDRTSGGGGGGHGSAGTIGSYWSSQSPITTGGNAGSTNSSASMASAIVLGAGGGGTGKTKDHITDRYGGDGGGSVVIYAKEFTGTITVNGEDGDDVNSATAKSGCGGGAGGAVLLRVIKSSGGSITASGGSGGDGNVVYGSIGGDGGNGGRE